MLCEHTGCCMCTKRRSSVSARTLVRNRLKNRSCVLSDACKRASETRHTNRLPRQRAESFQLTRSRLSAASPRYSLDEFSSLFQSQWPPPTRCKSVEEGLTSISHSFLYKNPTVAAPTPRCHGGFCPDCTTTSYVAECS